MKVDWDTSVGLSMGRARYITPRVGIELEYEGVDLARTSKVKKWRQVKDYSLRNGGTEWVSSPLQAADIAPAVRECLDMAVRAGAQATIRCGVHVHVNVGFMTWRELYQFIALYTILEPYLFYEYAKGREISHFCVPTWTNTALIECMYRDGQLLRNGILIPGAKDNTDWARASDYMRGGGLTANETEFAKKPPLTMLRTPKYCTLNLQAIKKFGTVELRQAPGSTDAEFSQGAEG